MFKVEDFILIAISAVVPIFKPLVPSIVINPDASISKVEESMLIGTSLALPMLIPLSLSISIDAFESISIVPVDVVITIFLDIKLNSFVTLVTKSSPLENVTSPEVVIIEFTAFTAYVVTLVNDVPTLYEVPLNWYVSTLFTLKLLLFKSTVKLPPSTFTSNSTHVIFKELDASIDKVVTSVMSAVDILFV